MGAAKKVNHPRIAKRFQQSRQLYQSRQPKGSSFFFQRCVTVGTRGGRYEQVSASLPATLRPLGWDMLGPLLHSECFLGAVRICESCAVVGYFAVHYTG